MQKEFLNFGVVIRTPILSFTEFSKQKVYESKNHETFSEALLNNALFVASPILYNQLGANKNGKKQDDKFFKSLLKYYTRACTRCTPYGLFAGLHSATINEYETQIVINSIPKPKLRLDMDYLVNVYHDLCKDENIVAKLIYYPNTSLYKVASKWRYHEFRWQNTRTVFHLVNIDDNVVLAKLIRQGASGLIFKDYVQIIQSFGFDENEANNYLQELIQSQVLVSELYPNVSGAEYQSVLFEKLSKFEKYKKLPSEVNGVLESSESIIRKTENVKEVLSGYFITAINESKFIQVDTLKQAKAANLNESIPAQVLEAAEVLNRLTTFDESLYTLTKFKRAFYERYEDAEVSLLELLDTDIGINYKNASSETEYRSSNKNNMLWDVHAKFRFDMYVKAQKGRLKEIALTEEDIKPFKMPNHPLPNTFAFMGELLQAEETIQIMWGGISNNATILPGRFGHLDRSIKNLCIEIAQQEEQLEPNKIFAEVVHISEGRLGNILTRPHYRKYEIPYLAQSTLPYENQIQVNDLMVSVKYDKVVLRSKRLNKEVLPRMANAHNYSAMGLPIYHFLCDLQHQGVKGYLGWNWSFLGGEKFLPRVTYKNVILSAAYWNVPSSKLKEIQKLKTEQRSAKFAEIIQEFDLPENVFLSEGDNELLLDFNNPICIDILLDAAKKSNPIKLTECLFTENNLLVKDEQNNGYTNEIIIPFVKRNDNVTESRTTKLYTSKYQKRIFEPYSEWVYFKIYTGTKSADKILVKHLAKVILKLKKENVLNKWFFIRYADPKNHLRLRFNLNHKDAFNALNDALRKELTPLVKNGLVWKIQTDTYYRELERYGNNTMELSEDVFCVSSELTISLLKQFTSDNLQANRFIIGLIGVVGIYDAFGYSTQGRLQLITQSAKLFGREFGLQNSQQLRDKIKDDYRTHAAKIEWLEKGVIAETVEDATFFVDIIREYKNQKKKMSILASKINLVKNGKQIDELMPSYIHMFVNRYFSESQRFHELMIYQLLEKYYLSKLAREKYKMANNAD